MEIILDDITVNLIIVKKNIKNIYFRFDDNLNLVVSANKHLKDKEIINLVNQNAKSLRNMYTKCAKKITKKEEFWYLGNKYEVVFDKTKKEIDFQDGVITCKDELTLNKFLKNQIIRIFTEEVENLKKIIQTPEFTLKIRKMKTRWGVCNYKTNTITLNSELIRYSKECLRYVIVHEMCHFYHHDHSPSFWALVKQFYPDYNLRRKELKY